MDYFSFGLNVFTITMQGIMHLAFTGRLTGKKQKTWHFIVYLFLLYLIAAVFSVFSAAAILAVGMELIALYAINRFAAGSGRFVSWTAAILAIYITQLSFGILNSVEVVLFPFFIGKDVLYLLIILATLTAYGLCACCYTFMLKGLSLKEKYPPPYIGLLLFPGLFFFAVEFYILQTSYSHLPLSDTVSFKGAGKHLILLFLQVLGLCAWFCTQYAYQHICRSFQTQAALASLTQAAKAQKTYIAEAQMRDEQTKAFRHDIKNHLSVLGGLIGNGKLEEAKNYLQKLEAASALLSFPYQTGNPVVDILLEEKLGLAKNQGIRTEVSLVLPRVCALDDFDLCVIFSNALDNAVKACESIKEPKYIQISGKRQGSLYLLEFTNTCSDTPLPPMGTGLLNIQAAAEKYHGAVLTEKESGCFYLHVLLNISIPSDGRSGQTP